MADSPDYILELGGKTAAGPMSSGTKTGRPWISVLWRCCGVYSRVYRNRAATAYEGYCPKCARPVRVKIGPGGTSARLFEAH
jgi:hypothetical protein